MKTQQYIEHQMKDCRERWFKEHIATIILGHVVHGTEPSKAQVTIINWQRPGTWTYGCRFIIHRRWLMVVGDIGEAVFEWSQDIDLPFLASLDFGYFLGKCEASYSGKKFVDWSHDVAETSRVERITEIKTPSQPLEEDEEELPDGDEADELELLEEIESSKDGYASAAQEYYDRTGDAEGASTISEMGVVPSCHAIGMFVGLQMAIAQLKGGAS